MTKRLFVHDRAGCSYRRGGVVVALTSRDVCLQQQRAMVSISLFLFLSAAR